MITNRQIAGTFRQIASALELLEANRFRINGNLRVARVLRDMTEDVASLVAEQPRTAVQRLMAFDGIGYVNCPRRFSWN